MREPSISAAFSTAPTQNPARSYSPGGYIAGIDIDAGVAIRQAGCGRVGTAGGHGARTVVRWGADNTSAAMDAADPIGQTARCPKILSRRMKSVASNLRAWFALVALLLGPL